MWGPHGLVLCDLGREESQASGLNDKSSDMNVCSHRGKITLDGKSLFPSFHYIYLHHRSFDPKVCHVYTVQWGYVVAFQWPSRVWLSATLWTVARQASLSLTLSWSLPRIMPIELVMPSNHLILHHPLLLLPSVFPSIRVFSNELALRIRWPKQWSFSFSISPFNECWGYKDE